jgi:hypothetical protein
MRQEKRWVDFGLRSNMPVAAHAIEKRPAFDPGPTSTDLATDPSAD